MTRPILDASSVKPAEGAVVDGPVIRRRRLGNELRELRETRSIRLADVAARLGVTPSTVSRIETGKAPTRTCYLHTMLDTYGVHDHGRRQELANLAREGQHRDSWARYADVLPGSARTFLGLEDAASQVCSFAAQLVPELLQTEEYAEAACRAVWPGFGAGRIRRLVGVVLRRQELRAVSETRLHQVVDESVLLRTVGSKQVMAGQLGHLRSCAGQPLVTLQVAALSGPHVRISPSFTVLTFGDDAAPAACHDAGGGWVSLIDRQADANALQDTFAVLASTAMPPEDSAALLEHLGA